MKKKILFLLALLFVIPCMVKAETYTADSDYVSIDFDNNWYVFTRENYKNNSNLSNLGVTEEKMSEIFTTNNIYLDAFTKDYKKEFFVRKLSLSSLGESGINNMNDYSDTEFDDFAKGFISSIGAKTYDKVVFGDYKYIHTTFESTIEGKNVSIEEYVTIVNNNCYVYQLQGYDGLTNTDKDANKMRVMNAVIKDDSKQKETPKEEEQKEETKEETKEEETKKEKKNDDLLYYVIGGAAVGAVIGGVGVTLSKKKNDQAQM